MTRLQQPPDDAIAITTRVANSLERLGVAYAIVGSLASSLHGIPRSTNDADIIADLDLTAVDGLLLALGGEFYADSEAIRHAIARRGHFNVIHLATMFKVDVFVVGSDAAARGQLERAIAVALGSGALRIGSVEDTIVRKLHWYREGGEVSERQWLDVLGMLRVQGDRLRPDLLEHLAEELDVADLLRRARAVR